MASSVSQTKESKAGILLDSAKSPTTWSLTQILLQVFIHCPKQTARALASLHLPGCCYYTRVFNTFRPAIHPHSFIWNTRCVNHGSFTIKNISPPLALYITEHEISLCYRSITFHFTIFKKFIGPNFKVRGWNPTIWPCKWKLSRNIILCGTVYNAAQDGFTFKSVDKTLS